MIYLAGPLFTAAERTFNIELARHIKDAFGEDVFLPQSECAGCSTPDEIFTACREGIDRSRVVVAILDGTDADSGTCFEAGYAYALNIPVIGLRTDFRHCCDDGGLNLMLSQSCRHVIHLSSLESDDPMKEIIDSLKEYL